MFLDCPAYLDQDGAVRCGLPAEVRCRFTMRSTDGPVESAMIRCPAGHYFCGAIESLTWNGTDNHDPGRAAVTSRAGRDSVQRSHDGRDGTDGSAVRHFPAEPERRDRRPNTAPAYYLGHPARLWITVMRPRRSRSSRAEPAPGQRPFQDHDVSPGMVKGVVDVAGGLAGGRVVRPGGVRQWRGSRSGRSAVPGPREPAAHRVSKLRGAAFTRSDGTGAGEERSDEQDRRYQ